MFQRLFEIGATIAKIENRVEVYELLRDPIPDDYKNLVEIVFAENGSLESVEGKQINKSSKNSILYKKGAPNGSDVTAVSMFVEDPAKTVKRVKKAIDGIVSAMTGEEASEFAETLAKIGETFDREFDAIVKDVKLAVASLELSIESRGLLSIAFRSGKKTIPVWSLPEVATLLVDKAMVGYAKCDKPNDCVAEVSTCSVCRREDRRVFGNFNKLKTYNLDKPGNIAGGFSTSQTVRNFPVCPECAATLTLGINTAETVLSYKMAGQSYLLLPQCHSQEIREEFLALAEKGKNRESLGSDDLASITEDEHEILEFVADDYAANDQVSLKLVFYDKDLLSWKIRAEVDQVLPSRIRKVFEAKKRVEQRSWRGVKEFVSMSFVREFAGGSFTNSRREFLGHIEAIFAGGRLNATAVLRNIVDQILIATKKDEKNAIYTIRRGLMLYDFYQQLSIISLITGRPMDSSIAEKSSYGKFLDSNPQFFGSPEKRVAFLTGALVRCVMNAQYDKLKSTPFSKKLKGMRITPEMLRKLVADCKDKLRAYDADNYPSNRSLMELLCEQWVACGDRFNLSMDETTFCFTIGMTLNYHVTQEFEKQDASEKETISA